MLTGSFSFCFELYVIGMVDILIWYSPTPYRETRAEKTHKHLGLRTCRRKTRVIDFLLKYDRHVRRKDRRKSTDPNDANAYADKGSFIRVRSLMSHIRVESIAYLQNLDLTSFSATTILLRFSFCLAVSFRSLDSILYSVDLLFHIVLL